MNKRACILIPAAALSLLIGTAAADRSAQVFKVRLSPDPLCVRVGSSMNISVGYQQLYNFVQFPAEMFRWDEDPANVLGTFTARGLWKAAREGTSRIYVEPDGMIPARSRLRAEAEVRVSPAKTFPAFDGREVVACYFPWFTERFDVGPPRVRDSDGWSEYTPTIKPYDPQSEAVTEQHIRMAKDAGVDAFAVSWFTNRVRFDFNYDEIFTPTLNNLVRLAPSFGFKVHIHYEAHMNLLVPDGQFTPLQNAAQRAQARAAAAADFAYLLDILAPLGGEPAFFVYLAEYVGLTPQDWKTVIDQTRQSHPNARFYAGTFNLAYLTAFDGLYDFGACYFQSQMDQYAYLASRVKSYGPDKKFIASVAPGYDARIFWKQDGLIIPRGEGEYYQTTWDYALAAKPDGIFISTWNEWGESSIIEPAKQYGYKYIDMTADNVIRYRSGR